jgi:hypothetical protein
MISYSETPVPAHPTREDAKYFTRGFKVARVDDVERLARGIARFAWTPAEYRNGYRCEQNFLRARWIGLDFDNDEEGADIIPLDEAVNELFADYVHIIGTTKSHQKSKKGEAPRDRFRVMLRMSCGVTDIELYRYQLVCAMREWPCDAQCKDAARFFWPCREIVSTNADGLEWNVMFEPADDIEARRYARTKMLGMQAARSAGLIIPRWIVGMLENPWPVGQRNNRCFRIGAALGTMGYSPEDIVQKILRSPTYREVTPSRSLLREIERAVLSGMGRGFRDLKELETLQRDENK